MMCLFVLYFGFEFRKCHTIKRDVTLSDLGWKQCSKYLTYPKTDTKSTTHALLSMF